MNKQNIYIEWLVLKAQTDEPQVINELLELIRHKLLAYARRLLPERADADDCVQDALWVIANKIHQLKEPKAFHGWIYRIVHSRCQDLWRKQRPTDPLPDETIDQGESASRTEMAMDLSQAISCLSVKEASVVHLFYFEGFTVVEIGHILETPAGTVKSLLFQARGHIKSWLTQESDS
ncbi:RNA polymerase sigma factor [Marinicella sediminis]|uniref:RNA polymerase sigma factor n=1 Tax=Marinicella sediminis TaxID=1792834 RepID=A0ABV7JCQ6_9GAMM|nr:RNA polymerase sigma factor [Marinicella sediminis]